MIRRNLALGGLLAITLLFLAGLTRLFSLRFADGDAYPPGSSRRADPRGMRALHDGLAALPGYTVRRNPDDLSRAFPDPSGHTLFLLGYAAEALREPIPQARADAYDAFARGGGRVVLALAYASVSEHTNAWFRVGRRLRQGAPSEETAAARTLTELWGFKLEADTGAAVEALHDGTVPALAARIPWVGTRIFAELKDPWRVIYARDGGAVVMQRTLGRGSVVLLADDFLASNEALRHHRETALLTWLVGSNRQIVFDETHLGLTQDPGLASLVHRYHLGGAVLGLLVLAGLYLWQQSLPFIPRISGAEATDRIDGPAPVLGREAAAGFRNLVRRAVPPTELAPTLFERWCDTTGRRGAADRRQDAQDILNLENARPPKQRDPLRTYHQLADVLNPKSP